MLIYLDTNIIIRYLTRDIEKQAQFARNLIESDKDLFIPDVVLPEVSYILTSQYKGKRVEIANSLVSIVSQSNIKCNKYILFALALYKETKNDMADCIIVAESLQKPSQLATLDKNLLKIENVIGFKFN